MKQSGMLEEEWRDIPGEPGYQVSSNGRVKSCRRTIVRKNGRKQTIRERILKPSPDEWGYAMVGVNRKTYKIHRLVSLSFMPQKKAGQEIRHLDGDPANNNLINLAYGSHSENVLDCYDYRGKVRNRQKLTENSAALIKSEISAGRKSRDIAKEYGVSEQTICDIKHGRIYARVEEKQ